MDIQGKIAVVTGASSGIGRQVAIDLVRGGARVVFVARNKERLDDAVNEARRQAGIEERKSRARVGGAAGNAAAAGGTAIAIPTDVTDPVQVAALKEAIGSRFGLLNLLVNCAGVAYFGTLEGMLPEQFDAVMRTNVYGVYHVTRALIPLLKLSQGMIANISSGLGDRALPLLTAYSASKSAVNALSEGLRLELEPYGVKVLNVSPPEVDTSFESNTMLEATGPDLQSPAIRDSAGRRKKASVASVSHRILTAIRKDERDAGMGASLRTMNFYAPGMVDKMFSRMVQEYLKGRRQ